MICFKKQVLNPNWDPNVRSGEFYIRINNHIHTTIINPEETLPILVIPVAKLNGVSNFSAILMFSTVEVSFKSLPILGIVFDMLKCGLFYLVMRANLT